MRRIAFAFLLFSATAYADDLSDTSGELMVPSEFGGRKWGIVCPYGQYHNHSGVCVPLTQSPECPEIKIGDTVYPTHLSVIDVASFLYHEASGQCRGSYTEYTYNSDFIIPVESEGDFLDAATFSGALCKYGEYHLDGTCVAYGSEIANGGCGECATDETTGEIVCNAHMTVAIDASFMAPRDEKPLCNGDYYLYDFVDGTNSPSYYNSRIYPLYNGTLLMWGAKIYVAKDMTDTKCTVNGDEYYQTGISNDNPFVFPERGICGTDFSKFVVLKNCHHITNTTDIQENWFCGVLCEKPEYVYTNSGRCSTSGYCENGAKKLRLHVARPDGEKYSYPLYASKTSDPAMHFKFVNTAGAEQMCYVNLVPPEAINHFVGEKPNPIRTMFYNPATGENEILITID